MRERMDRRQFLTLAGGASALVLGACASQPGAAPAKPGAQSAPTSAPAGQAGAPSGQKTKITFASIRGIFDQAYLLGAIDAGVYDRDGFELEMVGFQDDVAATRALIAGEVLFYETAPARPLSAVEQGTPLKAIGVSYAKLPFIMLARREVAGVRDLPGKSSGIGTPGDLNHQIQLALLRKEGIDPNSVTFVPIGPTPQIIQALIAGKIDAGTALFSNELQVKDNPDLHKIADVSQEFPNWIRFVQFVKQETIERQDALLRRFIVTHSKAWRWAVENREAVIAAAVKHLSIPEPVAAGAYDAALTREGMITPDFTLTPEQMQTAQELNVAAGTQSRVLPFDQIADLRYVEVVKQELGPYKTPVRGA